MAPSLILGDDGLSEYERLRLTKIARNNAYLESLGLRKKIALNNTESQNIKRKRTTANSSIKNQGPRRSSKRIKDLKVDLGVDKSLVASDNERAKRIANRHSFDSASSMQRNEKSVTNKSSEEVEHVKHDFDSESSMQSDEESATSSSVALEEQEPAREENNFFCNDLPTTIDDLRDYEKDTFLALREWKRKRGRELGYNNPCVICHNRTLLEMCRLVPGDKESLLGVWGISPPRLEQHGKKLLEAFAPWRRKLLEEHRRYNFNNRNEYVDEKRPSKDWINKESRLNLPNCAWEDMRSWCAREKNCSSCIRHGADGSWAICSQRVLDILSRHYGGRDAGWRWYPRKTSTAHNHQWWPPQAICDEERLSFRDLPLGTMKVMELLSNR